MPEQTEIINAFIEKNAPKVEVLKTSNPSLYEAINNAMQYLSIYSTSTSKNVPTPTTALPDNRRAEAIRYLYEYVNFNIEANISRIPFYYSNKFSNQYEPEDYNLISWSDDNWQLLTEINDTFPEYVFVKSIKGNIIKQIVLPNQEPLIPSVEDEILKSNKIIDFYIATVNYITKVGSLEKEEEIRNENKKIIDNIHKLIKEERGIETDKFKYEDPIYDAKSMKGLIKEVEIDLINKQIILSRFLPDSPPTHKTLSEIIYDDLMEDFSSISLPRVPYVGFYLGKKIGTSVSGRLTYFVQFMNDVDKVNKEIIMNDLYKVFRDKYDKPYPSKNIYSVNDVLVNYSKLALSIKDAFLMKYDNKKTIPFEKFNSRGTIFDKIPIPKIAIAERIPFSEGNLFVMNYLYDSDGEYTYLLANEVKSDSEKRILKALTLSEILEQAVLDEEIIDYLEKNKNNKSPLPIIMIQDNSDRLNAGKEDLKTDELFLFTDREDYIIKDGVDNKVLLYGTTKEAINSLIILKERFKNWGTYENKIKAPIKVPTPATPTKTRKPRVAKPVQVQVSKTNQNPPANDSDELDDDLFNIEDLSFK